MLCVCDRRGEVSWYTHNPNCAVLHLQYGGSQWLFGFCLWWILLCRIAVGLRKFNLSQHPHDQLQDVHMEAHRWTTKQMVLVGWVWWCMWRPAGLESPKLQMVPFPLQHTGCFSNVVRSYWGRTACELAERNMLNNDMWNIPIRCFSPSKPSFIFLFNIELNTSCCKNASNVQNGGFAV